MKYIEYALKHNRFFQRMYVIVFSLLFRFMGIFIKTDSKQVLFQSLIGLNYGDSPKVIFDAMKKDPAFRDYKYIWAFEKPEQFDVEGAQKVKLNSLFYFITAIRSGVWVCNVNIERGLLFKPKKTVFLNTGHGAAFKLDGNSQKNRNDYNYSDVDMFCVFSEFDRMVATRDYRLKPEATVKCGVPRDDELYTVTDKKISILKQSFGIPENKKVICYAPTWRDSTDEGNSYSIAPPMDVEKWRKELGDEYVLLLRTHPLTNELLGIQYDDFIFDGSKEQNVNNVLSVSDILITDYSSIAFDYAILRRPIIAFAYDYDEYLKTRGLNEDLNIMFPGSVFATEDQVINHIKHMDQEEELRKSIRICNRYCEADGHATQECMDFLKKKLKISKETVK